MEKTDEAGGFREPTGYPHLRFAVSKSNVWDPKKIYSCPRGFHWAMKQEYDDYIKSKQSQSYLFFKIFLSCNFVEVGTVYPSEYAYCGFAGWKDYTVR